MLPQKMAIVGLGVSGRSAFKAAANCGIEVCGFDQKTTTLEGDLVIESDPTLLAGKIIAGGFPVAVVSPGISPHTPLLRALRSAGIELWSEVELAWRIQESGSHAGRPWFVVTGTNGKTTTVGLLTSILTTAGMEVCEVGNVGLPITSQVDSAAEVFVVEISSFQLETTLTMAPELSICLNIESDHVDWHGSVEEYQRAKARVYDRTRGARVFFASDPIVQAMAPSAIDAASSSLVAIGENFVPRIGNDIYFNGEVLIHGDRVTFWEERGYSSSLGEDIQAAAALALLYGIAPEAVRIGIETYQPDAHRQALVSCHGGINWIDDSKATNSHAAAAALRDKPDGAVIWIAGGDTKGQTFDTLVEEVAPKLKAAVLIGKDRQPLAEALARCAPDVPVVNDEYTGVPEEWMPHVVAIAADLAQSDDYVVLAPACASWDQFVSYAQRGEIFSRAVLGMED